MGDYKKPSVTVDIIIFDDSISIQKQFILINRKNNPFKHELAIPGGFVEYGETTEHAAIREAKEETDIDIDLKKLFNVYSKPDRDPRGHTITIVYLATGNLNNLRPGDDAEDGDLYYFDEINSLNLAFDHEKILNDVESFLKNESN